MTEKKTIVSKFTLVVARAEKDAFGNVTMSHEAPGTEVTIPIAEADALIENGLATEVGGVPISKATVALAELPTILDQTPPSVAKGARR